MIHEIRAEVRRSESARYSRLDIRHDRHPLWIVSLVLEGRVETSSGDWSGAAGPGDAMVHPPGVPFSERNPGPGWHAWGLFSLTSPRDEFDGLSSIIRLGTEARELFDRLPRDPLALPELVRRLRSAPGRGPKGIARQGRFATLLAAVEAAPGEEWTRDRLARAAAMHPTAFDRAFRREEGAPPGRAVLAVRLRAARRRLVTTDAPLGAIATACGFHDAANFSRAFRREFGVSPGRWRIGLKETTTGYFGEMPDA